MTRSLALNDMLNSPEPLQLYVMVGIHPLCYTRIIMNEYKLLYFSNEKTLEKI